MRICDSRCGCVICADCLPGKPCGDLCDGNCVVCAGILPPGPRELGSSWAKDLEAFLDLKEEDEKTMWVKARPIRIIGPNTINITLATLLFGDYFPSREIIPDTNGAKIYVKQNDPNIIIEFSSSAWQFKTLAQKQSDICIAFLPSRRPLPLERVNMVRTNSVQGAANHFYVADSGSTGFVPCPSLMMIHGEMLKELYAADEVELEVWKRTACPIRIKGVQNEVVRKVFYLPG